MSLISDISERFRAEFTGKIIAAISGGLLTVALARLLTPDNYGLLFLAISILGTLKLFSQFGIAKSAARYIAEYKETNPTQLSHIVRFSFLLNLSTIAIVCVFLFSLNEFIAELIGEPDLIPLLEAGVFFIIFSTLLKFVRSVLQGFEAIKPAATLIALDRSARLVFAIGLVLLGFEAIGALTGYIFAYGIAAVIGLIYIYSKYYRTIVSADLEQGIRRQIAEYAFPLTITGTAGILDKRIDTVLVGFFVGPAAVAYYTISRQISQFITTPVEALGFTLSPTYESQVAKGDSKVAARIYEQALSHTLLLYIPGAAGLILVAEPMIDFVFGPEYLGVVPVLQILSIFVVLQSVKLLTDNGLDFLGRARDRAIIKSVAAILNFGLNLVLIPRMGVIGAAIATVATDAIYTFSTVYIMNTELDIQYKNLIWDLIIILFISGLMSIIVYIIKLSISGLASLIIMFITGFFIWLISSLILNMISKNIITDLIS